ncbi:MAG: hypothetical protein R2734_14130 [Nocardioides sp.]
MPREGGRRAPRRLLKAAYGAELGRPLAARVAQLGWSAWNVEYRRVGSGVFPQTFDDVHAAVEARRPARPVGLETVVALGHSAGGHLATWAAARSPVRLPLAAEPRRRQ